MDVAIKMYFEEGISLRGVANLLGIDHSNLLRRFKERGIKTRDIMSALAIAKRKPSVGGQHLSSKGYMVSTNGDSKRYTHRIIAEKAIGRRLTRNEIVHHIDGNKLNNSNPNLLICTKEYHSIIHAKMNNGYIGKHLKP